MRTPAQALGSQLERFLPDAVQSLSDPQLTTHAQLGEMTGLTAAGKPVALEASVSFERHPAGDTITIFARDLTARKKIEAHRNALESQLRESHKMQAVGTMAGGIAHDFNNIISAILGNAELAKEDAGENSPALVSLAEIDKAGRRARDLVRQILTFSRNESPKRVPIQLADVVEETVRLLKVALPPSVQMLVNSDPDTPPVLADATQVEQALLNLCTNAIQAIGNRRGTVSIELGHQLQTDGSQIEKTGSARVASTCAWRYGTPAAALMPRLCSACLNRSSQPNRLVRERAWGLQWFTASCAPTSVPLMCKAHPTPAFSHCTFRLPKRQSRQPRQRCKNRKPCKAWASG